MRSINMEIALELLFGLLFRRMKVILRNSFIFITDWILSFYLRKLNL